VTNLGIKWRGNNAEIVVKALEQNCHVSLNCYREELIANRIAVFAHSHHLGPQEIVDRLNEDEEFAFSLYQCLTVQTTNINSLMREHEFLRTHEFIQYFSESYARNGTFRVWIPYAGNGSIAYVLGMLLFTILDERGENFNENVKPFEIFASDMCQESIARASKGEFSRVSLSWLPPELRDQFFEAHYKGFRVKSFLRDTTLFFTHDLLNDPPLTDVSLFYLGRRFTMLTSTFQGLILPISHQSLREDGILLTSPTIPIPKNVRIFNKLNEYSYKAVKSNEKALVASNTLTTTVESSALEFESQRLELEILHKEIDCKNQEIEKLESIIEIMCRETKKEVILKDSTNKVIEIFSPNLSKKTLIKTLSPSTTMVEECLLSYEIRGVEN
jgi:chemotaxis methyl-accepting protein methylase